MNELDQYDYHLPADLIAQHPAAERDAARLLIVDRGQAGAAVAHRTIRDLPELLRAGDCLVLNDTRVVPARLRGVRAETGGRWEGLFLNATASGWRLLCQTRGRLRVGERICVRGAGEAELFLLLIERDAEGIWLAVPESREEAFALLARFGTIPLPPYIAREEPGPEDLARYQTTFARHPGAVAAPTAGLHLTAELLEECRRRGVQVAYVTLHVGIGTFRPITAERLDAHRMHAEWCELTAETADQLSAVRAAGGRVVAVGTTTVRTLETAARSGRLEPFRGETDIFLRPPYQFRVVDALLTNFHLPRSTLLVLLSAFAGRERVLEAYRIAVAERYRFYSYGDAMFLY